MAKLLKSVNDYDLSVLSEKEMWFWERFFASSIDSLIATAFYPEFNFKNPRAFYKKGWNENENNFPYLSVWGEDENGEIFDSHVYACRHEWVHIHPDVATEHIEPREPIIAVSWGCGGQIHNIINFEQEESTND